MAADGARAVPGGLGTTEGPPALAKTAGAWRVDWRGRGLAAFDRVDWPGVAICMVPLAAMALFALSTADRRERAARPPAAEAIVLLDRPEVAPWQGHPAIEDMPLASDNRSRAPATDAETLPDAMRADLADSLPQASSAAGGRMAIASVVPATRPWSGNLAIEDMPAVPDARSRAASMTTKPLGQTLRDELAESLSIGGPPPGAQAGAVHFEPLPPPWHGDLAIEDLPLSADMRSRSARMPVVGSAAVAAAPAPICIPDTTPTPASTPPVADFGRALASAARAQAEGFVIYNARYMSISYPGGDTQPLYGVCTDVVVRAYRALGIDLQELIHASRIGRGDPSIDHRRVEVVSRFFERHGASFELSEFAEDFLPGDIVTYHRPRGRVSQHHIAVVSDRVAPSGRPLIVHNRGWGPQLEDALFVDRMTGHYRFTPHDADTFARTRQPPSASRGRSAAILLGGRR